MILLEDELPGPLAIGQVNLYGNLLVLDYRTGRSSGALHMSLTGA